MHADGLISKHFAEGLEAAAEQRMRAHLRQCARCRAQYDRAATLLRAAAGAAPTAAESEALWRRIDAAISAPDEAAAAPTRRRGWGWPARCALAAAAAAGIVAAGLLMLQRPHRAPRQRPRVQLRGGATPRLPLVALEIFAVERLDSGFATPRAVGDGRSVPLLAYVQFRYRNDDPALGHAYIFGLDERRSAMDYFPRPAEARSVPVRRTGAMEPIGRSIRLGARHRAGPLWVCALFSERPLTRAGVHAAVTRMGRDGAPRDLAGRLERLLGRDGRIVAVVRRLEITEEQP